MGLDSSPDSADGELVRRAVGGSPQAFNLLVERHFGLVYALGYARLRQREAAEDLAQEVFHRAFLHLDRLEQPGQFGAWVGRIARNLAIDWERRGQTRSRLIPLLPLEELPAELADGMARDGREDLMKAEESEALKEALEALAPAERELVLLHFAEGLSFVAIGESLGVHPTTVARRIQRSLRRMRRMLEPILREAAPGLSARRTARVYTAGLIMATAAFTSSSREILAAAAAEGFDGLTVEPAAAAMAAGRNPIMAFLLFLWEKVLLAWDWFLSLTPVKKTLAVATSLLVAVGGGGAILQTETTPDGLPMGLFYCAVDDAILRLNEKAINGGEVEVLLYPDRPEIMGKTKHSLEKAAGGLILTTQASMDFSEFGSPKVIWATAIYLVPDGHGGYSVAGSQHDPSVGEDDGEDLDEVSAQSEKTLASWRSGVIPESKGYRQALLPIVDERLVEMLRISRDNLEEGRRQIDEILGDHPDDTLCQLVAMDIDILREDADGVRRRFVQYEPAWSKEGTQLQQQATLYYTEYLAAMDLQAQGKNLAKRFEEAFTAGKLDPSGTQMWNWTDMRRVLGSFDDEDCHYFPRTPYLLRARMGSGTNFFAMQTAAKLIRVRADFCLFEGKPLEARDWLVPVHRMGIILTGRSNESITALIGMAFRAITEQGLAHAYLDGMWDARQIEDSWPMLDALYRSDRAATQDWQTPELKYLNISGLPEENNSEAQTRNGVSHARMACLHGAVAARHQLMTTGSFPSAGEEGLGTLLPQGPGPDPFTDFQQPLSTLLRPTGEFTVYSVGPDRGDQQAAVEYDPTNGTISGGDIFVDVPRERKYPFPQPGDLARDRDGILAQFPNGLPPDPFADVRWSSYAITGQSPAYRLSWGPDVDQARRQSPEGKNAREPMPMVPPAGDGVSTWRGGYIGYPDLAPDALYDPTNGTVSQGDLYIRTGEP